MIDELIRIHVAPILKAQGFKKKGLTWNRAVDCGFQVFDIQKDAYSVGREMHFTVNLGILVKDVWDICWAKPVPQFVQEVQCYPRFRIGYLLNGFDRSYYDKWWAVSPEVIDDVGNELNELMLSKCMTFYERLVRTRDVAQFVEEEFQDKLPLERIQRAVLLGLYEKNVEHESWPMVHDEYWGAFARAARERLVSCPTNALN